MTYAEYMKDLLKLVKKRRKTLNFKHRVKSIEKPLLEKIAGLYMKCAIRFTVLTFTFYSFEFLFLILLSALKFACVPHTPNSFFIIFHFQGDMSVWREALDFFKKEHMNKKCSEAFAMLIQVRSGSVLVSVRGYVQ